MLPLFRWQYAYACQLDGISRIRNNWSWSHMKQHRELCRQYRKAYKAHLVSTSGPALKQQVAECEASLDLFNITLVRRQVEVEVRVQYNELLDGS